MPRRRMHSRRKQKANPDLVNGLRHTFGLEIDPHAQGFPEHPRNHTSN